MGDRIVVMKDGYVYQVDTPKNIYDHPANIFVASFIGSPQMNFIDVKLFAESDKLYVSFGNAKLVIPDEIKNKINPSYMGKEVVMGIRPEDIHDEPALLERYPEYCFYTNVDVVELMGSETFLYMDFEGNTLTARVDPGSSAQPGDKIKIGFNMNKVHLFDKDTTNRIF
jgi:multiple sugar transport system ATP-binding protein